MTLRRTWAAAALVAAGAFAAVILPHYLSSEVWAARGYGPWARVVSQGPILATYLGQIAWPDPDRLLFYYDHLQTPAPGALPSSAWAAWAMLGALMALAWAVRHRYPLSTLGILWFFCGHILTSNVVPLELAFEHRNYLALFGVVLATLQPLSALSRSFHLDARRTAASILMLCLALLCALQSITWSEPFRLAITLAARNPESGRASYDLGRMMLARSDGPQSVAWSLARDEFLNASAVSDSLPLAEQGLIIMYAHAKQPVPVAVWERLERKFGRPLLPESEGALWQLLQCAQTGLCPAADAPRLFAVFTTALRANPKSSRLHSMYAAFAYSVMRDQELGIRVMREAIRLAPADHQFKANLARFLLAAQRPTRLHRIEAATLAAQVRAANAAGRYDEDLAVIASLQSPPPSP